MSFSLPMNGAEAQQYSSGEEEEKVDNGGRS